MSDPKRGVYRAEMKRTFVIMQIGNSDLDVLYDKAISPSILKSGFEPKRIDKHNQGGLLKSEIVNFIETSDIIIADLTNERPNCYLEIGYAMGLDKFRNLILTAREDHNPDSPNYKKGGPKIHFDLAGYDILFWDPNKLDEFKDALEKKIKRRIATLPTPTVSQQEALDDDWMKAQKDIALVGLKSVNKTGFMEIRIKVPGTGLNVIQSELLNAADKATIHTFGWPIGVVMRNVKEYIPHPTSDGIVANINTGDKYDYWTIKKDGTFFLLATLFEDMRKPNSIFFNTRIIRITETLLYAIRLYTGLKVPPNSRIIIGIRHYGLKNRILEAAGSRDLGYERKSVENEVYSEIDTTIVKLESDLIKYVEEFTRPLFMLFEFFELNKSVLEDIVNKFVEGKID